MSNTQPADFSLYSAFGLTIASELPLPELPSSSRAPDIVIRRGEVPFVPVKATRSEQFVFNTLAGRFRIKGGTEIVVDALEHADDRTLRVVLLGRVMACLIAQRGWLPLHGSGVMIGDRAVLILGPSGVGKSTLAAALHARGHIVITDDIAPVRVEGQKCYALPAWSRLRLSNESMSLLEERDIEKVFQVDKYSLNLVQPSLAPTIPVARIYELDIGDEFRKETLPPLVAASSLSTHSFVKRHRCDREVLQDHLSGCAAVAECSHVQLLFRSRFLKEAPALASFIERDLESDACQN